MNKINLSFIAFHMNNFCFWSSKAYKFFIWLDSKHKLLSLQLLWKFFKEIGQASFPHYKKFFFSVFLVCLKTANLLNFGQYNTLPSSQFKRFYLEGQIPKVVEIIWSICFSLRVFCGGLQSDCGFKSSSATKIKLLSKRQLFRFLFQLFDSTQLW